MKNAINYYYNLNPLKITKLFNYYYFYINSELYFFIMYNKSDANIKDIFDFNRELINKNVLVNEIINNRNNTILTIVNKVPYILVKVFVNINKHINISEISYLSNIRISYPNSLMRDNWANLWIRKIDYIEYLNNQNRSKYPLIKESINYFIGMAENAISYINNTIYNIKPEASDIGVISHSIFNIDNSIYSLYDPLNIIIDHKSRDIGEYIKISFFNDNMNIFNELDEYFKHNYYSYFAMNLLVARIMYPSFYFNLYDDILNNKVRESEILKITSRINDYESYLREIFIYLNKYYNLREITWIKNSETNSN